MRQDMDVTPHDTPVLRLRRDDRGEPVLTTMTRILGMETDVARAAFLGVTPRTMARLYKDDYRIGEVFVARAVTALRRHADDLARYGLTPDLDSLFEVAESPELVRAG